MDKDIKIIIETMVKIITDNNSTKQECNLAARTIQLAIDTSTVLLINNTTQMLLDFMENELLPTMCESNLPMDYIIDAVQEKVKEIKLLTEEVCNE